LRRSAKGITSKKGLEEKVAKENKKKQKARRAIMVKMSLPRKIFQK